jgi:crotonobetainyl-CoA:carnitine CoA-transferase CaiB-like acyl-CoA transferase
MPLEGIRIVDMTGVVFEAVGDTAMGDDPRVVDPVARNQHIQWLYERVGEAAAARTVDEWLALCRTHGIPAFRAATLDDVAAIAAMCAQRAAVADDTRQESA